VSKEIVVALDGMGGDNAPDAVVRGADMARERYPDTRFLLFGDEARLGPLVARTRLLKSCCQIRPATDVVSNDDKPSAALRRRRKSSMWLAIEALAQGEAQCVVSGGNTGALLAMSMFVLRTLADVHRPALASFIPTMRGESVMLDLGANVECDETNLTEFAVLGSVFAKTVLGLDEPTVGLLNVGAEEVKGHEALRDAATMLKLEASPVSFAGFVEGNDIVAGAVDVVVTDGFTGNIALKAIEGTARLYTDFVREAFKTSTFAKLGYLLASGAWQKLRKRVDPRRYNGGVFLGLNGICVKSHGGTDDIGFAYAVGLAVDMIRYSFSEKAIVELRRLRAAAAGSTPGPVATAAT